MQANAPILSWLHLHTPQVPLNGKLAILPSLTPLNTKLSNFFFELLLLKHLYTLHELAKTGL